MNGPATRLRTAWSLGPVNILRVGLYRAGLKSGFHPAQRLPVPRIPAPPFFTMPRLPPHRLQPAASWREGPLLFGHLRLPASDQPPDWHRNAANGRLANATSNWWEISDFDPALGDIKPVWELSRMAWTLPFAQAARNGDEQSLLLLDGWLENWLRCNPPYKGVNWKCGQEASIRVMHLAMAAHVLRQLRCPSPALVQIVEMHLRRIAPTLAYAKGQDNNHGTSEAAALFIGGLMLGARGKAWHEKGRAALEERVARLVMPDGSFSQYSLVYHRLMLDTLSMAEIARRAFEVSPFTVTFQSRARAATLWMQTLTSVESGDGPNVGANDGAHLLPLTNLPTRDFRPSLQLAAVLFTGSRAIAASGTWDDALTWLGLAKPEAAFPAPLSMVADDGGFAVLRTGKASALLRYPRFRFRPSHSDALHVDLCVGASNWFGDAGSYSYNTDPKLMAYFNGTVSHNTIEFDGRNQMPQLGRFLFGDWLKASSVGTLQEKDGAISFTASYHDGEGAWHRRSLTLTGNSLRVEDDVGGFRERAVLRWRLLPDAWSLSRAGDKTVTLSLTGDAAMAMTVTSSAPIRRSGIVEGWTSLHYLEKQSIPVLEIEVSEPASLSTLFKWSA